MAIFYSSDRFRFLFRQDRGVIDAATWRPAAALLGALLVATIAIEWFGSRTARAISIGVTAIFVAVAMLIAACYYFVSVKRFRDRGRSPLLALALPAALFVDAALRFMQPGEGGYYPLWFAYVADAALLGVAVWNVVELGFMGGRAQGRGRG